MCAIFGLYNSAGFEESLLIKMSDISRHRGLNNRDRCFYLLLP